MSDSEAFRENRGHPRAGCSTRPPPAPQCRGLGRRASGGAAGARRTRRKTVMRCLLSWLDHFQTALIRPLSVAVDGAGRRGRGTRFLAESSSPLWCCVGSVPRSNELPRHPAPTVMPPRRTRGWCGLRSLPTPTPYAVSCSTRGGAALGVATPPALAPRRVIDTVDPAARRRHPWERRCRSSTRMFVQRTAAADAWDLVVLMRRRRRGAGGRDGGPGRGPDDPRHPDQRRYLDAQGVYRDCCRPLDRADVVVDNTDPSRPHPLGS